MSDQEKLEGFRRLEKFVRAIEKRRAPEADFDAVIAYEKKISASLNGRTVFDDKPKLRRKRKLDESSKQRSLF